MCSILLYFLPYSADNKVVCFNVFSYRSSGANVGTALNFYRCNYVAITTYKALVTHLRSVLLPAVIYDSEKKNGKVTVASKADITRYDDAAPETLFIRIYKDEVKEMVIIK